MSDTYNATQANANLEPPGPGDNAGRNDGNRNGGTIEKDFQNGSRGRSSSTCYAMDGCHLSPHSSLLLTSFQGGYDRDHEHLHGGMDPDLALRKVQTAGSISISPELFEKIYLSPQNRVSGDLRKTFGNPTP